MDTLKKYAVIALLLATPLSEVFAAEWVDGGGQSCSNVCVSKRLKPVDSGTYKNDKPFHVCSTDAENEGSRAGYNLEPDWANACWVGWGGREFRGSPYKCLCE